MSTALANHRRLRATSAREIRRPSEARAEAAQAVVVTQRQQNDEEIAAGASRGWRVASSGKRVVDDF